MKLTELKDGQTGYINPTDLFTHKNEFMINLDAEIVDSGIAVTRMGNVIIMNKTEVWQNLNQIDKQLPKMPKALLVVSLE